LRSEQRNQRGHRAPWMAWPKNPKSGFIVALLELAALCAYLCSEWGGYVTGQLIMVDGGFGRSAW
jgi:NAD(P)-dependent dehydrogenase (short-subunit alcohol dehydrogenase family)